MGKIEMGRVKTKDQMKRIMGDAEEVRDGFFVRRIKVCPK
jgi:hypothetical protein